MNSGICCEFFVVYLILHEDVNYHLFFLKCVLGGEHCCSRLLVSSPSFRSSVLCPYFVWELAWRNDLQYPERSTRGYTLCRLGTLFGNLKALRLSFGERWCMLFSPSVYGLRDLIAAEGIWGCRFVFFSFFLKFMTWCSLTSRRVVCVCRLLVITNDQDTQIWILIALRKLPWIVKPMCRITIECPWPCSPNDRAWHWSPNGLDKCKLRMTPTLTLASEWPWWSLTCLPPSFFRADGCGAPRLIQLPRI